MFLKDLHIVHYKNYQELSLSFSSKINFIIGNNGVGKTNILDSVYYLAMTKSYFSSSDAQNIKHGEDFFVLQGIFEQHDEEENIYCALKKGQKKKIKRNDKEYTKIAEHIGLIPTVMVSPADYILISGSSEERRRYMDSVISQFNRNYLYALMSYNKVLQQRNAWLKDVARGAFADQTLLSALNVQLVKWGKEVFEERLKFISELEPIFINYYRQISGGLEAVNLKYKSRLLEEDFIQLLESNIDKDFRLQHTSVGIHRDDILLNLGHYSIKQIGSQGQQKSFLVALKFAQFDFFNRVHKRRPILLLDDIFDKLDFNRVKNIIHLVSENHFGQIFISDTHKDRAEEVLSELQQESKIYYISNNQATEE